MLTQPGIFLNRFIDSVFCSLNSSPSVHVTLLLSTFSLIFPLDPRYVTGLGSVLKVLPPPLGQHFPNEVGPPASVPTLFLWE